MLAWTSIITLFLLTCGVFVLIALRGLVGLISDGRSALRAARSTARVRPAKALRNTAPARLAPAVQAKA
jgi:hypothetical protein